MITCELACQNSVFWVGFGPTEMIEIWFGKLWFFCLCWSQKLKLFELWHQQWSSCLSQRLSVEFIKNGLENNHKMYRFGSLPWNSIVIVEFLMQNAKLWEGSGCDMVGKIYEEARNKLEHGWTVVMYWIYLLEAARCGLFTVSLISRLISNQTI